jgi:hypothetical protein
MHRRLSVAQFQIVQNNSKKKIKDISVTFERQVEFKGTDKKEKIHTEKIKVSDFISRFSFLSFCLFFAVFILSSLNTFQLLLAKRIIDFLRLFFSYFLVSSLLLLLSPSFVRSHD